MILRIAREKVGHRQGPIRQTPDQHAWPGVCICAATTHQREALRIERGGDTFPGMDTRRACRSPARLACAAIVVAGALASAVHAGTMEDPASSSSVQSVQATQAGQRRIVSAKLLAPGLHELAFSDGSTYRGTLRGATFQGHGEFISRAFRYEGDYRDGLRDGRGTYTWPNGDRYEGRFVADRPDDPHGAYSFANGDRYEGEVRNGVLEGHGVYVSRTGDRYEGAFHDGVPDGIGTYRFTNGDRYEGEVAAGHIEGHGRYRSARGDVVEATFSSGRARGIGRCRYASGDVYEGEFADGAPSGQGSFVYRSGLRYEGEVRDGAPRGTGVVIFPDGRRFEGHFEGAIAGARGELVLPNGERSPARMVGEAADAPPGDAPSGIIPGSNPEASHG